jgi:hypothetical protein
VHFRPKESLAFFLFVKKTNSVEDLYEMRVDPDGIMRFWGGP